MLIFYLFIFFVFHLPMRYKNRVVIFVKLELWKERKASSFSVNFVIAVQQFEQIFGFLREFLLTFPLLLLLFASDFKCSWTKFIAIIVNVCMQNFRLTVLTFRVTFTPLTFCVLRDLKISLSHNFKQLKSTGGNLILKVKWKVRRNWCHFRFKF